MASPATSPGSPLKRLGWVEEVKAATMAYMESFSHERVWFNHQSEHLAVEDNGGAKKMETSRKSMIQPQSYLAVADNSGAKKLMCIRVLGVNENQSGGIGDVIIAVVKEALPNMALKRSDIVRAVIVRTCRGDTSTRTV